MEVIIIRNWINNYSSGGSTRGDIIGIIKKDSRVTVRGKISECLMGKEAKYHKKFLEIGAKEISAPQILWRDEENLSLVFIYKAENLKGEIEDYTYEVGYILENHEIFG